MRFLLCLLLAACVTHLRLRRPEPLPPPVTPSPTSRRDGEARLHARRWVGKATGTLPTGERYEVTQTERMGPLLGGDIVVIEGRGYKPDGTTGFNAFAIASWNPHTRKYELRSYAQGHAGTFELVLTDTGFTWEVPAGPEAVMRFTATVTDRTWRETGDYVATGRPPVRSFEMNLERVGDTDWPLGTPVSPER